MFLAMLMISVRRGTPSVTFLALTPAKWKVLRVICAGVRGAGRQGGVWGRRGHSALAGRGATHAGDGWQIIAGKQQAAVQRAPVW